MHEFSFAYNIFKVAEATAIKYNAKKITEVFLEIGELTLIVPDLLRRSFEIATKGSIAEGAKLNIQLGYNFLDVHIVEVIILKLLKGKKLMLKI